MGFLSAAGPVAAGLTYYYLASNDYDFPTSAFAAAVVFLALLLVARATGAGARGPSNPGRRISRKLSFMSEVLAKGAFPAHLKVPDFPINGVLYVKEVPTQAELEALVMRASRLDRLHSIPVEQKNGEWFWQPVPDFDVHDHLYVQEVADDAAVHDYLEALVAREIKATKPLWEVHVAKNTTPGGESAICMRVCHSIGDGISMVPVFTSLMTNKDGSPVETPKFSRPRAKSGKSLAARLSALARMAYLTIAAVLKVLTLALKPHDSPSCLHDASVPYEYAPKATAGFSLVRAPTIPLALVKEIKEKAQTTVNDVLTAALAGAYRRYLAGQNDPLAGSSRVSMRALLPFAFPWRSKPLTNQWCFLSVKLPAHLADPLARLRDAKRSMDYLKASPEAFVQLKIQAAASKVLPAALQQQTAIDLMSKHSCVFSNVPGPQTPLYVAGHEVTDVLVFVGNVVPQVTVLSYNGSCSLSFCTNKAVVKDPDMLAIYFHEELQALHAAAVAAK